MSNRTTSPRTEPLGDPATAGLRLPAGFRARPLDTSDARAVYEVMAAEQQATLGRVDIEEADIVADWQRPSFDVPDSTVGVFHGDRLVAYAEHSGGDRGDAAVHPEHHGRGLGTQLAGWMRAKAGSRGAAVVGMPVPQGGPGDRLLESLGYRVRWTSWVLQLPAEATVPERPLPEGYRIGAATPAQYAAAHAVVEDAFLEWAERDRSTVEDFLAGTVRRPGWEAWMMRVVTDPEDRVAAVAVVLLSDAGEAYVDRLATRADQRHRGLAQALLVDSFATGREHGATTFGLATDSRTGALDLYRKVGMEVVDTWLNRGRATS